MRLRINRYSIFIVIEFLFGIIALTISAFNIIEPNGILAGIFGVTVYRILMTIICIVLIIISIWLGNRWKERIIR